MTEPTALEGEIIISERLGEGKWKHSLVDTKPTDKQKKELDNRIGMESDDELLDYARANGSTVYHASCSCKMGSDETAVVDDELRVHGIESLRVIDASVMPAVTSTNTNAPTIMIAEKGAAIIKAAARAKMAA